MSGLPESKILEEGSPVFRRVPELDALRGIGALAIVAYHLWPEKVFCGWSRADLFFTISGYLITSVVLKYGKQKRFLLVFWTRRALRIWPAYYLLLLLCWTVAICEGHRPPCDGLVAHLTLTQHVSLYWSDTMTTLFPSTGQSWSLAIEEQFYLVWPVALLIVGRSWAVPLALWMLVNSIAARINGLSPYVALSRCDGLALGSILAVLSSVGKATTFSRAWLTAALACVGVAAITFVVLNKIAIVELSYPGFEGRGPWTVFAVNVAYFSMVGLISHHSGHNWLRLLRSQPLRYLGKISYGVYLNNLLVIEVSKRYFADYPIRADVASFVLSIIIAALLWELVGRPFGHMRRLLPYQSVGPGGDDPTGIIGSKIDRPMGRRSWIRWRLRPRRVA